MDWREKRLTMNPHQNQRVEVKVGRQLRKDIQIQRNNARVCILFKMYTEKVRREVLERTRGGLWVVEIY